MKRRNSPRRTRKKIFFCAYMILILCGAGILWMSNGLNSKTLSFVLPMTADSAINTVIKKRSFSEPSTNDLSSKENTPASPSQAFPEEPSSEEMPQEPAVLWELLSSMSIEEKVGQMFIVRCPSENAIQSIKDYHLGGYILFARDFETRTKQQAIDTIQSYQDSSSIPMLIGVDEEGGTVNRISKYPAFRQAPFPSPQKLYQSGGFDAIQKDTLEKCQFLQELGVNLNFAPVADVSENPGDFIYPRSFGQNASLTAQYIKTVVTVMQEEQMGCVLKHFPGYGNNKDTHKGIAYDSRPFENFTSSDFLPFEAGIQSGAECVLVSHNIVKCMDENLPASLSPRVHEILRNDLGFSGVIMTDDLYMDGIRDFTDASQAAVAAVQAGNDLLCCTDFTVQIPAVLRAVENGEISEDRIEESVFRILQMKYSLGLLQQEIPSTAP